MVISYKNAEMLESLVKSAFKKDFPCDKDSLGGLISAYVFQKDPLLAAILLMTPLYCGNTYMGDIDSFLRQYSYLKDGSESQLYEEAFFEYYEALSKKVMIAYQ